MSKVSKILVFLVPILLTACIEPYFPQIESIESKTYVIGGFITNQEGYQNISISLTSQVDNPTFIPLADCIVKITDNHLNVFTLIEFETGNYRVWMNSGDLATGTTYKLSVLTPAGIEIESTTEIMPDCPDIDSIYFIRKDLPTISPSVTTKGIQFYLDVDGRNNDCRYFRWEIEETYEYHSLYPIEWYYDGEIRRVNPPDYSRSVCWQTLKINDIFTLSTTNLTQNVYKKQPLNFVSNQTPRLLFGYSLLVKQFGLTETAYTFWEQLRINSSKDGGLYEKQPLPIDGNLVNITNPNQKVLGLFSVSSVKSKRIIIRNVAGLESEYITPCALQYLRFAFKDIEPREFPGYFIWVDNWPWLLQPSCVDCLVLGGTNIKPDFWS
jgi:hypothetical protein